MEMVSVRFTQHVISVRQDVFHGPMVHLFPLRKSARLSMYQAKDGSSPCTRSAPKPSCG
jgi:hypothetical protein